MFSIFIKAQVFAREWMQDLIGLGYIHQPCFIELKDS